MAIVPGLARAYGRARPAFALVAAALIASGVADRLVAPLAQVLARRLLGG